MASPTQDGKPDCGHFPRLVLLFSHPVGHDPDSCRRRNSRQCSVAFAIYFFTELTDTLSCTATWTLSLIL
ncbi:hypothetical protein, partial [Serratia symbiotica]|uniref:hypothetical protein n=1 Tax=Serratia symbiotica TaxID=138074 RepID=UPI001E5E9B5D